MNFIVFLDYCYLNFFIYISLFSIYIYTFIQLSELVSLIFSALIYITTDETTNSFRTLLTLFFSVISYIFNADLSNFRKFSFFSLH